jgi:hypothetical protein
MRDVWSARTVAAALLDAVNKYCYIVIFTRVCVQLARRRLWRGRGNYILAEMRASDIRKVGGDEQQRGEAAATSFRAEPTAAESRT